MKSSSTSPKTLTVLFPDKTERSFSRDATFLSVITAHDGTSVRETVAVRANGSLMGLGQSLGDVPGSPESVRLEPLTFGDPEAQEVYHHSSSHILAQAVKDLFPSARLAIGPAIDDGYYYDFEVERPFSPEDLERIESRMREIIDADPSFERLEMSKDEAIAFFKEKNEPYKIELIRNFREDETVTMYRQGDFIDLCRGPHVFSTGGIKAFKLLSTSGAYWRGHEGNPMLQRIYGTSFQSGEALEAHLVRLEEIRRRDHRRIGRDLDLYSIQDEIGPGLILWHPKGAMIRTAIENFFREQHQEHGYEFVNTPHIARLDLWAKSGHLDYYRENMFPPMALEGVQYQLKPMNCPFHIMIYQSRLRSYRDLPVRFTELGTVYRYERSGVLHGSLRVRGFTQDDAHIFCRPDQLEEEIVKVLEFCFMTLRAFGFNDYQIFVSTRPEKAVGTVENWDRATAALESALKVQKMAYEVDPGEGVFYGPKIDLKIKDALGRTWQCATIQVDFNLPARFDLGYIAEDSKAQPPIMIHRALMGSIERFFGILIEHYAGAFPLWLAPVQVKVLPITDQQQSYAREISETLTAAGLRAEVDGRNEKVGLKIREAEMAKVPYMAIVGKREAEARSLSLRARGGENIGAMELDALVQRLQREVQERITH
jgi:threonyl-tRNA synthetase